MKMKKKTYTVEMSEKEYQLYLKLTEKDRKEEEHKESLLRSKTLKDKITERVKEYNIENVKSVSSSTRYLIGVRCGVKSTGSRGITQKEFEMMCDILDLIFPSKENTESNEKTSTKRETNKSIPKRVLPSNKRVTNKRTNNNSEDSLFHMA